MTAKSDDKKWCKYCRGTGTVWLEGSIHGEDVCPKCHGTRLIGYKAEKSGEKYIKFVSNHTLNVDLFLCTPETWGCIFMIRTGSAEFTRKMVTRKVFGGWCPNHLRFDGGRLLEYRGAELVALETPEESIVFDELGLTYVPPEFRSL